MSSVRRQIHFERSPTGQRRIVLGPRKPPVVSAIKVPRITRLMALAIKFDRMIRERNAKDLSELARKFGVSQPRVTQIMNLLHLAPDIQEALLRLQSVPCGREQVNEHMLRSVAAIKSFVVQRTAWQQLTNAI